MKKIIALLSLISFVVFLGVSQASVVKQEKPKTSVSAEKKDNKTAEHKCCSHDKKADAKCCKGDAKKDTKCNHGKSDCSKKCSDNKKDDPKQ
jgi:hypothetical protein